MEILKKKLISFLVLHALLITKIYCNDGDLDITFNPTGTNTNTPGTVITPPAIFDASATSASADSIAIQSDGKIVAGGNSNPGAGIPQFSIARYNTNGSLDTTFNGTGTITNSFATSALSIAIQSDNKIVGVGTPSLTADGGFAIARYNTNGTLDATFNGTGMVTTSFVPFFGAGSSSQPTAVVIQPTDQKIVVAGILGTAGIGGHNEFLIARYTTAGVLDVTFNGTGFINISPSTFGAFTNAEPVAVSLQSDGKIVIAGNVRAGLGTSSFALARLNTNGTLDTTFNSGIGAGFNGVEVTNASSFAANPRRVQAFALTIQSDDKIIVAGDFQDTVLFNESFAIARYNKDGTLDTTFNTTGTQLTQAGITFSEAHGVGVQSTGKIVLAGFADDIDGNLVVALTRYTTTGILDTTFGTNGIVLTPPASFNANFVAEALALAIQSDDKIVIAGLADANTTPSSFNSFALARFLSAIPIPSVTGCQISLNQAIIDKYGL